MSAQPARLRGRDLFADSQLPLHVGRYLLPHGDHFPHDHDFWEAVLVLGGTADHTTPRGTQRLARGDVLLLRPGTWHTYTNCEELTVINCCIGAAFLTGDILPVANRDPRMYRLLIAAPLAGDARGVLSFRLPADCYDPVRTTLLSLENLAEEAFTERFARLLTFLSRLAQSFPEGEAVSFHSAVQACMRLFSENLSHPWTVAELARCQCLAPAYLTRCFTRGVGVPPMAYLGRLRAEQAAGFLIREPGTTIGEIGARVGIPDANYFARFFRAHFGVSPRAYRGRFVS